MRIWLDPLKMARYGLTPSDITQVLNEQNVEVATGTLGAESSNTFQYVLKYRGRYVDEEGYENLVIRSLPNGDVLRIKDIARVELGSQNYNIIAETNGSPGVNISINQVAGSNANEIIKQIDREIEDIRGSLPPGIVIEDLESKKDFLDASITSVVETLLEALALVILVVFLFLQSWRATIIPAVAIMVSLIATLAVIYAIGFSLNMLTLFALVLVIPRLHGSVRARLFHRRCHRHILYPVRSHYGHRCWYLAVQRPHPLPCTQRPHHETQYDSRESRFQGPVQCRLQCGARSI